MASVGVQVPEDACPIGILPDDVLVAIFKKAMPGPQGAHFRVGGSRGKGEAVLLHDTAEVAVV